MQELVGKLATSLFFWQIPFNTIKAFEEFNTGLKNLTHGIQTLFVYPNTECLSNTLEAFKYFAAVLHLVGYTSAP